MLCKKISHITEKMAFTSVFLSEKISHMTEKITLVTYSKVLEFIEVC